MFTFVRHCRKDVWPNLQIVYSMYSGTFQQIIHFEHQTPEKEKKTPSASSSCLGTFMTWAFFLWMGSAGGRQALMTSAKQCFLGSPLFT